VGTAVAAACRQGATIVNVHASGGKDMMIAAAQAAEEVSKKLKQPRAKVLAVTVLTSLNQKMVDEEIGLKRKLGDQVVHLAKLAQEAGLDGVVASPREIKAVRAACGATFIILTPGIRPAGADLGDQKRTLTPGEAMAAGANYIVVGRPVVEAKDPAAVVRAIHEEMEAAVQ
jgi:orotidine-5'-phosphate decarboxylase